MTVYRVPVDFPSIAAAVTAPVVRPYDTIAVGNGVYSEVVVVPAQKPGLRLVSNGDRVILDGGNRLSTAFIVRADNVEIDGFTITGYVAAGIRVSAPRGAVFLIGAKLTGNTIIHISQGAGIELIDTFATLVGHNRVTGAAAEGLRIASGTMNTWALENQFNGNGSNGLANTSEANVGGVFAGNHLLANSGDGVRDVAGANLIIGNTVVGNGKDGVHEAPMQEFSGFAGIIWNTLSDNRGNGINLERNRNIVANNLLRNNTLAGVRVETELNVVQENEITDNNDNGVLISAGVEGNLILRNELAGNTPFDLNRLNPNNDIVENHCFSTNPPGLCQ